jgi:predicted permease
VGLEVPGTEWTRILKKELGMRELLVDLRHALRGFRRSPFFTLVAVISLALAVGVNVFVFGVLDAVVLRPLEIAEPDNLYQLRNGPRVSGGLVTTSYPAFQDLRQRSATFRDLVGVYAYSTAELHGRDVRRVTGLEVTGNYFDVLGVRAQAGRVFHAADEQGLGSAPYVVLSDTLWRGAFQADPRVIGTTVTLDDEPFTVVGVAAAGFHGTERLSWPDYWIPIVNKIGRRDALQDRSVRALTVIGRLPPGVTVEQATEELSTITAQLAREHPATDKAVGVRLIRPGLFGDDGEAIRRFLHAVHALTLLLLAAVSVNLASAFSARAADRRREIAIRVALGSSRLRLARQLLTEALTLSLIGGAIGLAGTSLLLGAVNRWTPPFGYGAHRLALSVDVEPRFYVVGLLLTVASALVFGLVPVRQAWATSSPLHAIKGGSPMVSRRGLALQDVLLGAQIAICTLLVAASLVAVRGMVRALDGSSAGIRPQGAMLAAMDVRDLGLEDDQVLARQQELIAAAGRIPGVVEVGAARETPLSGGRRVVPVYRPEATERTPATQVLATHVYPLSPGYLRAAGTRLLAGRDVTWHDTPGKPRVALVNETFARTMWGTTPALGQRFVVAGQPTEVVGLVEDGKYHNLMESPAPATFVPLAQAPPGAMVLVVRSRLTPEETATALRALEPGLRMTVRPWRDALSTVLFPARAAAVALGVLGVFAALLAVTGLFGMAAHRVSRRFKELGIRIALGARRAHVLTAAIGRPAVVLAVGSALGLLATALASPLLGRVVYEADPAGAPAVLIGAVVAMALVGVCGSAVPAMRALAIDPSPLMREDAP